MSLWDKITGTTKAERQIERIMQEPEHKVRRMEKRTGMTQFQRIFRIDPDAEVPGYILTEKEHEVWADGGNWWKVGPQPRSKADLEMGS
jgi:hypothetical protein